ncbi:MAG: haloacid dehalogenase-like hydrolase [Clostridia bacterium]|nr:haloacid dehalogenase-like hydrolase [Clostridia bacterium]
MRKPVVAICYDFDKTLATDYMQNFTFVKDLGMTADEFWTKTREVQKKYEVDGALAYLFMMKEECESKGIKFTRSYLNSLGKDIVLFKGVESWFKRMNDYAKKHNIQLEHYIISSGNKEILEGTNIFKEFTNVFGCEYLYDENGEVRWLKNIVNYTLKTQYLFKICKGVTDPIDESKVNEKTTKKHVEFRNMIYIGDGFNDIPCMSLTKEKGGIAICVYENGKANNAKKLVSDGRVNYACLADYSENSEIDKLIKLIIDAVSFDEELLYRETKNHLKKIK